MTRNLKALGLALFAVFALGAVMASAAAAHVPARFTAEEGITITGVQIEGTHKFKVTNTETQCEKVKFHGTAPSNPKVPTVSEESITITPTYEECFAEAGIFGTIEVTVTGFKAGECDYRIRADGKVDIECAEGKEITVDAATCTIHVPAQPNIGTLTYEVGKVGEVHDLKVNVNLKEITANHTDGFGCPLESGGEGKVATLTGTTTVTGENALGNPRAITWDATTP